MSIKKQFRLNKKKEIEEVKKKGELMRTPLFSVLYLNKEEKKVGIVVSKKVMARAVDRNKIRRRLSEVINKEWQSVKGWNLFLTKKELLNVKIDEIEECLKKLF